MRNEKEKRTENSGDPIRIYYLGFVGQELVDLSHILEPSFVLGSFTFDQCLY